MREDARSSGTADAVALGRSSSPSSTPATSSAAASSRAVPINVGSTDWHCGGQGSKAGSISSAAQVQWTSDNVGNSASGSSQFSCRPWERGDLLRRLATFKPSNWFARHKGASSLACARRGWVNIDTEKIKCESCGSCLTFATSASWKLADEAFVEKVDSGHNVFCPWRGTCCADSLVQFPPTPLSALVGGYKDRCDGLLQFPSLPIIASSAIETMRLSRDAQIDLFLLQPQFTSGGLGFKADNMPVSEMSREDAFCQYTQAQKLISLCGWEPRWIPNVQDCEEQSAQSARNACSFGPIEDAHHHSQFQELSKNAYSASANRNGGKGKLFEEWRSSTKSPLLDCSLCGATVRVWDFLRVPRPARFGPNNIDNPDTCKKLVLTRGVSAASGINGWITADEVEKEQIEVRDEAATTDEGKSLSNAGINLNLTIGDGLPPKQSASHVEVHPLVHGPLDNGGIGRDLMIGQPAGSEVGDRAASFESRGPSTRKRSLEERGSTVDRPQDRIQQTDSIEGTIVDHDVDGIEEEAQESDGLSKRACGLNPFDSHHSSCKMEMSVAGPSQCNLGININRLDSFKEGSFLGIFRPAQDSARASSVVALDTIYRSDNEESMESVENFPGYDVDVNSMNDASEFNYSNQAQQSAFLPLAAGSVAREMGGSSTIEGDEILNEETFTTNARDRFSFGISGGSVGMGASHEAEIRGIDASLHQADSTIGDADLVGEVTELVGQSVESAPGPGLMGEFVPEEVVREIPRSDSQDMMSRSLSKSDSGSKIYGSIKADSIESGEKKSRTLGNDCSTHHPSLSYNAMLCSGHDASREEVTQMGKETITDDNLLDSHNALRNGSGPPIGEYEYTPNGRDFDPIKHHNSYCPWVNESVAAAGCNGDTESGSSGSAALCGWQLTLDALDSFQSLGHIPSQMMPSESAASLYKDDHLAPRRKILTSHSASKSRGNHFD